MKAKTKKPLLRVLVVEDDFGLGASMVEELRVGGYEVHLARTLDEAREKSREGGYYALFVDFLFGKKYEGRQDGAIEAFRNSDLEDFALNAREMGARQIIAMSGHDIDLIKRSMDYRWGGEKLFDHYIPKGGAVNLAEFLDRVRRDAA